MKLILLPFLILFFVSCSSKKKMEPAPTPVEAPAVVAEVAPQPEPTPEPVAAPATMAEPSAFAGRFPPIEGTERTSATCSLGSDVREIKVIDRNGGGCGDVYSKGNQKETIAMANNDMTFCDKVFENVKGNLTAGGFDCGGGSAAAAPAPTPEPAAKAAEPEAKPAGQ